MIGYHVTTDNKLSKYDLTGAILPPVRFWPNIETAERWAKKTGRGRIVSFSCDKYYPLPDHRPACWTPEIIRKYVVVT